VPRGQLHCFVSCRALQAVVSKGSELGCCCSRQQGGRQVSSGGRAAGVARISHSQCSRPGLHRAFAASAASVRAVSGLSSCIRSPPSRQNASESAGLARRLGTPGVHLRRGRGWERRENSSGPHAGPYVLCVKLQAAISPASLGTPGWGLRGW
jgi:hypothetical protein